MKEFTDMAGISAVSIVAFLKDEMGLSHNEVLSKKDVLKSRFGFQTDAISQAVHDVFGRISTISSSDPRVLHILEKLQELNLPVPTNLTAPIKPGFIPEECAHLIYEFPKNIVSNAKLLDIVVVNGYKVKEYARIGDIQDIVDTPKQARLIWANDGRNRLNVSPRNAEKSFVQGEIGGTARVGLHLLLYYPEILKHHYLDLPGSRYDRVDVPCLSGWFGRLMLSAFNADFASPGFGSVSLGVSQ